MRDPIVLFIVLLLPIITFATLLLSSRRDRRSGRLAGRTFMQANGPVIGTYLVIAVTLWTFLTIVFPQVAMIAFSFHPNLPPREVGGPNDLYTLENYQYFLLGPPGSPDSLNFLHLKAFGTTILVSVCVTAFSFALCYPLSFFMAQYASARQLRLLIIILVLPYWINEVLRVFAIRLVLSSGGIINKLLLWTGAVSSPIDFIGDGVALFWGLCYSCILMMVFTLYNALESLDKHQIEAARDLGAPWWHAHMFVILPHAKPGVASGCALTFMFCVGSLAAPLVLGGPRTLWFTPVIYNRFYQALNWPQGSAYSFVLLVSCITFVFLTLKLFGLKLGQIAR